MPYQVVVVATNLPLVSCPPSYVDSVKCLSGTQLVPEVCSASAVCAASGKEGEASSCSCSWVGKEQAGELELAEAGRCCLLALAFAALVDGCES